jgi:hypothetical protein
MPKIITADVNKIKYKRIGDIGPDIEEHFSRKRIA